MGFGNGGRSGGTAESDTLTFWFKRLGGRGDPFLGERVPGGGQTWGWGGDRCGLGHPHRGLGPVGDLRAAEGDLRKGQSMELVIAAVEKVVGWERTSQQPGGGNPNGGRNGSRESPGGFLASTVYFDSVEKRPISLQSGSSFLSFNYLNKATLF